MPTHEIVNDAGGMRLPTEQKLHGTKSADYLVGNIVFELKDLQEEVLEKENNQKRLAEQFRKYFPDQREVTIDPAILIKSDHQKYMKILSRLH